MNRVLSLDEERGIVTVEAGIQWPEAHCQAAVHSMGHRSEGRPAPIVSVWPAPCPPMHTGEVLRSSRSSIKSKHSTSSTPPATCTRARAQRLPDLFPARESAVYGLFGIIAPRTAPAPPPCERSAASWCSAKLPASSTGSRIGFTTDISTAIISFATDSTRDSFLARGIFFLLPAGAGRYAADRQSHPVQTRRIGRV